MAVNVIRSINGELANCDNGHKPGENHMTMNQVIPAKLIKNQCDEWLGPFRCELTAGHEGSHTFDSKEQKIRKVAEQRHA